MLAILGPIIGGLLNKSATSKAAKAAIETGKFNAAELRRISKLNAAEINRIAGINADAQLKVANLNSAHVLEVAQANSLAHIQSTMMNIDLAKTENLELLRRHRIKEISHASSVRAAFGASGVQVGQGSPIEVLDDAVTTGYGDRQYLANYATKRLTMMGAEGIKRANLTMLDANSRSKVLLETAALQASVTRENAASRATTMLNDAEANAKSLERGGQLTAATQRAAGTASLISGIMGGINSYMRYHNTSSSQWTNPNTGNVINY